MGQKDSNLKQQTEQFQQYTEVSSGLRQFADPFGWFSFEFEVTQVGEVN